MARLLVAAGVENPQFRAAIGEHVQLNRTTFFWEEAGRAIGGYVAHHQALPLEYMDQSVEAEMAAVGDTCDGVYRVTTVPAQTLNDYVFKDATALCVEDARTYHWLITYISYRDAEVVFGIRASEDEVPQAEEIRQNIRLHFVEIVY